MPQSIEDEAVHPAGSQPVQENRRGGFYLRHFAPLPPCSRTVRPMSHEDVQKIIDDDNPPGTNYEQSHLATIELVGDPFRVNVSRGTVSKDGKEQKVWQTRRVRIMMSTDDETGQRHFEPARESDVSPDEYDEYPLSQAQTLFELTDDEVAELERARKQGASTPFTDTEGAFVEQGAIPDYHIQKNPDSFLLPNTWKQIYGRTLNSPGEQEKTKDTEIDDNSDHSVDDIPW